MQTELSEMQSDPTLRAKWSFESGDTLFLFISFYKTISLLCIHECGYPLLNHFYAHWIFISCLDHHIVKTFCNNFYLMTTISYVRPLGDPRFDMPDINQYMSSLIRLRNYLQEKIYNVTGNSCGIYLKMSFHK